MEAVQVNRFAGKNILVTGAAQGIGAQITRRLTAEGAFVYAVDLNEKVVQQLAEELNRERRQVEAYSLDISCQPDVHALVQVLDKQKPIHGLVNSAAVLHPASFMEASVEDWQHTFSVNTHGTYFVSQSVGQRMALRGDGAIVTIASNAGSTPRVNMAAYCASKAATLMLTKCMGLELGKYGIRCNLVSPGSTETPMLEALVGDVNKQRQQILDGNALLYRTGIPLKKIAQADDIARCVSFLLSDDANHVTLQDLVVDGGATFG